MARSRPFSSGRWSCASTTGIRATTRSAAWSSRPLDELHEQHSEEQHLEYRDMPLEGVEHGTISFDVSFHLSGQRIAFPASPVHASAAQALSVEVTISTPQLWCKSYVYKIESPQIACTP